MAHRSLTPLPSPGQAPAAAPATTKPVLSEKDLKKVAKPDEALLKEKIAAEDAKIGALQPRLNSIREALDSHASHDGARGEPNSELAIAKHKFNEIRQESRRLQQACGLPVVRAVFSPLGAVSEGW